MLRNVHAVFFFLLFALLAFSLEYAPHCAAAPANALITKFEALTADPEKSGRRDLWLDLEKRFAAAEKSSEGESAALMAQYYARAREELSRRSFSPADSKEAANRYGAAAQKYATYPGAGECLFRRADILANKLKDPKGAAAALQTLISTYPKNDRVPEAKKRLAALGASGSAAISGKQNDTAGASKGQSPSTVTLKSIKWQAKGQKAVVTLEMDESARYDHSFLPPDPGRKTPERLYLDIAGTIPSNGLKTGATAKGLVVSRIRTGKAGNATRVTLECDGIQCYAVSSPKGAPNIIQIEVSRKEDIKGGISVKSSPASASAQSAKGGKKPQSVLEQLGLTVNTILLDAGHGGHDPGAQHSGITEKNFTLAMAKRIGQLLQKEGFTVIYTRSADRFITLQDRPDIANNKKADLFISIHVNASVKATVQGLETYYLNEAKSKDAATVAARENAVSVKNISDLQFILTDLMLSTKLKESRHLADCIHKGILTSLRAAKRSMNNNGVRSAPFYVLMGARMPAILVEFGYISNPEEAAKLKDEAFIQKQAEGVVRGVIQYRAELAKSIPKAKK